METIRQGVHLRPENQKGIFRIEITSITVQQNRLSTCVNLSVSNVIKYSIYFNCLEF